MKYVIGFIGNFIWKIFGGVWLAIFWFALAFVFAISIIGIPLAVKCIAIGMVAWKPTRRRVAVNVESHIFLNIIWFIIFSFIIIPFALVSVTLQFATIIGIPLSLQWYKVLKVNLFPFGAIVK